MKLLLADDHELFRDALVQYIERADPSVRVTLAKDLPEALDVMKDKPDHDLVLLDLRMPGMNGLQGFRDMREHYPHVPVALMSGVAEPEDVDAAIDLGAVGYFPKTMSGKALLQGIQRVLSGEIFLPVDDATKQVMPSYYSDEPVKTVNDEAVEDVALTNREKDVLVHLAQGDSNKEIARKLGLQVVTVKLHVSGICRKMGVQNRTQAALKARDLGLVA